MQTITRNIVGPGSKVYEAGFAQAENMNEVSDVIVAMSLNLEQVNEALRRARKLVYLAALESTVDSKIETAYQGLVLAGWEPADARIAAEANRAKLGAGLPAGLKAATNADGTTRISKRGRKAAGDKE